MKLVASLEVSPQGTKTSDHGTFSLYINIIPQDTHIYRIYPQVMFVIEIAKTINIIRPDA